MAVHLIGLTKRFGNMTAVDGINLTIADGEFLVLLGPSGCGKTTTMRSIVGLETPDTGTIRIGEQLVFDRRTGTDVPSNRRNIGMVFQSYAIWPHMTVFENVAFPLKLQRLGKREVATRVEKILEIVGLRGLEERGASMLSGGQMQRVALARSLVMQPNILLLDEPLSNLDAKLRDRLRFELKEIQQEFGTTSVYVTHDQSEALALADRIAVMNQGRIEQLSDARTLYRWPKNRFVADFLGSMNVVSATVTSRTESGLTARLTTQDDGNGGPAGPTLTFGRGEVLDHAPDVAGGADVALAIRPEDVTIASRLDEVEGRTRLNGTVTVASFLGDHTHYVVDVPAIGRMQVKSFGGAPPLAAGDDVAMHIDPERSTILAD